MLCARGRRDTHGVSKENVQIVKEIYSAWERGNFSSVEWADPEIEFLIPGVDQSAQRGIDAMAHAWAEWLRAFSDFSVEARGLIDAGDKVVVEQAFHGRGQGSGIPLEMVPGAAVLTLRDGKVVRFHGTRTLEEAREEAGIRD
jgi:ketosteroid isomerase-like protein